jgi:hypothetical protein
MKNITKFFSIKRFFIFLNQRSVIADLESKIDALVFELEKQKTVNKKLTLEIKRLMAQKNKSIPLKNDTRNLWNIAKKE